jgi:hypothetical protein
MPVIIRPHLITGDQPWFCCGVTGALSSGVGSSSESGCSEVPTSGVGFIATSGVEVSAASTLGSTAEAVPSCE